MLGCSRPEWNRPPAELHPSHPQARGPVGGYANMAPVPRPPYPLIGVGKQKRVQAARQKDSPCIFGNWDTAALRRQPGIQTTCLLVTSTDSFGDQVIAHQFTPCKELVARRLAQSSQTVQSGPSRIPGSIPKFTGPATTRTPPQRPRWCRQPADAHSSRETVVGQQGQGPTNETSLQIPCRFAC